ncbi:MBL fold metallo-hydrolase [Cohaesibacter celericrescens]|uniref:MBL fold metallo-hydrolase n=1 Tax=Cohaesibacter celericrescens TaxID=2067669 RepID=A0A2N5XQV1_9HYPH|nr:MBL fold metallo-hydrolase [Cohaesibacter celericrescens]PLW76883.1 MBL fold metallo-hydrolase [Cohaesibacter celericrescens]
MDATLKFCGAAGTVTGSCYLVRTAGHKFLIDCGMFQGTKTIRQLNYNAFPFDPAEIDFVLLTHAHIDHSGLLPKLVKHGFTGQVYMTEPTKDLLGAMLPDSGHIQEMDVMHLNRRNARRGKPLIEPMYTRADAEACQQFFTAVDYEEWINIEGIRVKYWNAGHILGSSSIELEIPSDDPNEANLRMLWSGDLGPNHKLFHPDPDAASDFDYVICESTYGGRTRSVVTSEEKRKILLDEIQLALQNNGILLIPAFAVERTQELLADILILQGSGQLHNVPIFLDSPLAIKATEVFKKHANALEDVAEHLDDLNASHIRFTQSVEESKAINRVKSGAIIMAGSGMCDAGRIRHHIKNNMWRTNATLLLVGFQAEGSLGRLLLNGARKVRIQGEEIQIRGKVRQIETYSGHADENELLDWIRDRKPIRHGLYLCHGEQRASEALKKALVEDGVPEQLITIPSIDDEVRLSRKGKPEYFANVTHRLKREDLTGWDSHNEFAELKIDLAAAFADLADDKARRALARRIKRALKEG